MCQSIKIKKTKTNVYIASARAQFKINTHRCWNWHLSVVQCSHGHVIGVAVFGAISVAWSVRAGQLAAGGVVSVWRSWVRSPPGPRSFIGSFVGLYAFPCARASKLKKTNKYVYVYEVHGVWCGVYNSICCVCGVCDSEGSFIVCGVYDGAFCVLVWNVFEDWCKKCVYRAGMSNSSYSLLWDVIIYACSGYIFWH